MHRRGFPRSRRPRRTGEPRQNQALLRGPPKSSRPGSSGARCSHDLCRGSRGPPGLVHRGGRPPWLGSAGYPSTQTRSARPALAVSTGLRNELGELFRWFHPAEGLSRPVVDSLRRRRGQPRCGHSLPFGKYWSPRGRWCSSSIPAAKVSEVAEMNSHAGVDAKAGVLGHLLVLVSGDRSAESTGKMTIFFAMASRTVSARWSPSRCTSIAKRVERSTKVAMALVRSLAMMWSPSQLPGTVRSFTSAGRSEIMTWPTIFPLLSSPRFWDQRETLPVRMHAVNPFRSSPSPCTKRLLQIVSWLTDIASSSPNLSLGGNAFPSLQLGRAHRGHGPGE